MRIGTPCFEKLVDEILIRMDQQVKMWTAIKRVQEAFKLSDHETKELEQEVVRTLLPRAA